MENKLKKLLNYQKFAQNPDLDRIIESIRIEDTVELSDEALFAAAGGVKNNIEDKNKKISDC